ncbi:MAG: glycosyl transferase group 1 [Firmicutes bacterium]|nr:glycosyl transferase group 1 [Bacillota bacterium]
MTRIDEDPAQLLVGQYIDTYLPAIDGVIITVKNYAHWLNLEHFPCYVATASAPHGYEDTEPYPIFRYASAPIAHRPPYRFGFPLLDLKFIHSVHDLAPQLVHTHSPFMAGREARRIARQQKIPLVATFHSKYYDDVLQSTGSKFLAEKAVQMIVRFYNHCDHVWTVNEGTAQTLRDYGYQKEIEIMPNGTDFLFPADPQAARETVEQKFGLLPEEKVMLYVGQHILQKNLPMLLEAAAAYAQSGGRFKLLMVGDGYARPDLETMARELGLGESVCFTGLIADRELLAAIFLRADLFLLPSIYDNAPLVIREAAAASCPSVLIAGSNAAKETQDEYNAYQCENTVESLSQAIQRAFSSDQQRHEIGRQANRTLVRTWQDVVSDVAERYQMILTERRGQV